MQSSAASSMSYSSSSLAALTAATGDSHAELGLTALQASASGNQAYPSFATGAIDPNLDSAGATHGKASLEAAPRTVR